MSRTVITWCILVFGAAACNGSREAERTDVSVDTVGGVVVVTNHGTEAESEPVTARRVASIGVEEGPPEYTFGAISSLAVDASGRIYVSDLMADEVRVYGPDGEFLESIGGRGDGPGEFRRPTGLIIDGSGVLVVRGETRVQRFTPGAPGSSASRFMGSHSGPPYGFSLMPTRLDSAGRLYYPMRSGRIQEQRYFYLVIDPAGSVVDTLALPSWVWVPSEAAMYRTGPSGGRMVPGLARAPFVPYPSWEVTPAGHLIVTEGGAYELVELDASGDTVRVVRRTTTPRSVPSREYDDSLRSVHQRVADAPAPVERLEGVADEIRLNQFPRTLPQILSVHLGTDGRIWVQRWPEEGGQNSVYDLFSSGGIYQRTVAVPARFTHLPPPVFADRFIYGVVVDPATDVQRVVAYEFEA